MAEMQKLLNRLIAKYPSADWRLASVQGREDQRTDGDIIDAAQGIALRQKHA
jgi:hypothetical protein